MSRNATDFGTLRRFEEMTDDQIETALKAPAICFETWRKRTFAERAAVVARAVAMMHERADEFAR